MQETASSVTSEILKPVTLEGLILALIGLENGCRCDVRRAEGRYCLMPADTELPDSFADR